jgi:hypothetical protein
MTKTLVLLVALAMAFALAARAEDHVPGGSETVVVQSGSSNCAHCFGTPKATGRFRQCCSIMGPRR